MNAAITQSGEIKAQREHAAVEVPTLLLILGTYGAWLAITYQYGRLSLWIVAPLTVALLALHSSLQHEILHGHPTRWRGVNRWFGVVPLSLWLPYERYRQDHLTHHIDDRLTDPFDDPETFYRAPEDWARMHALSRWRLRIQQTLAGRVLLGSFWMVGRFLVGELRGLRDNDKNQRLIWLEHLGWCVPVIAWIKLVCAMPLSVYVLTMVIPGYGIILIRSFAEHRARAAVRERTAIVEGSWIFGPLFLFNNLHAMHHLEPGMPWYQYNARYRAIRADLIAANAGLVYSTYFEVARRFLFRPHDVIPHPMGRIPPTS